YITAARLLLHANLSPLPTRRASDLWFGNNGRPELFCASADWQERNLLRRVEICFPILDPALVERIEREVLQNCLADNLNAWELGPDGTYRKCVPAEGEAPHSAQQALLDAL